MATASEQKFQEQGLGTVRKFTDERFFRKSPPKPYDRPPTSLRNNSWILKLVDPAQRLISSGSQMLFSSVFRNLPRRSTSRASSQVALESSQSRKDHKKANGTDSFEVQVATNVGDNRNRSDRFVMMELEKTLKQKTFTRSEFDHLTTLLHSRNVDLPIVNEEKRSKFISSIPESNRNEFVKIPNSEDGMGRQSISTPFLSSNVLDEDISSPAEIARAYMSRQPKVFPSMRSLQAQGLVENSVGPTSISFSSKSTNMLLVPSSTSQGLKRRSSFSDNDFGSIVPLRRIRQKTNIHLSKGLSLPVSARPISVPVDGLSFDASKSSKFGKVLHFPPSIRNSQLSLKPTKRFARKFIMNGENDNIPGAGSSSIYTPSRSYKMASKILEQLDKLTPPKEKVSTFNRLPVGEKSPPKPSPSTVGGPPLRSLEDVYLPRSKEFVDDDKQSNGLHGMPYHDNRDHTFQNKEKLEIMKPLDPHHKCAQLKDSGSIDSIKDSMIDLGVPASAVVKSTFQPQKNKKAFQMWPDKDNVDHDENSADRVAPADREGDISLAVKQTTANEALAPAKPQTTSELIMGSPLNRSADLKTSDNGIDDDTDTRFTLQNASSLCTTSQPETIDSAPTDSFENKDLLENKQSDPPVLSFGNTVSPRKQPNASSTAFDVGNKDVSPTELRAASENGNGAPYLYTQCNSVSPYSDVQGSVYLNADTSSNHKLACSWGTCNGAFLSSSASTSAGLAFPLSSSTCNQSLNSGTSISCPSLFSSYNSAIASMSQSSSINIFFSAISARNGANVTPTDNRPSTALAPSSAPSTTGLGTYEDLHNANHTNFNSISTPANSHYSMLNFSAAATLSPVNNQLNTPTVISATELSAQKVSAGTEFTPNTERTSMILGSSVSQASVSSGISFGCSSSASELLNSGSRPSEFPIVGFTSAPATSTICTSNATTSCAPLEFESFTGTHFSSICPTTSAAALADSSLKPISSNSHPKVSFRVSSGNNNDGEEQQGISKDNVPLFSQKSIPPPSSGGLNPSQFGKQQTLVEPQNSYPYIASSSCLEAKAGGRFSLSAGRGDKPNRRFLKVKRKK